MTADGLCFSRYVGVLIAVGQHFTSALDDLSPTRPLRRDFLAADLHQNQGFSPDPVEEVSLC